MKNSTHKAELNKNLIRPIDEDSFELKILAQMSNVKINSKDEPLVAAEKIDYHHHFKMHSGQKSNT